GVSNIKNKEYKRAIKEFEKVLELKPDDAYANYNLGYIYAEHLVDREKAIEHFKKYLTYAPNEKDANWVRKYVLTWQTWYKKNIAK
ncbi:MAG TPA: tetratricopeptide repeat protein, partial [Candidatus Omnitrophota bacterium]|nr:tetratricopeptide repeat protein [Candidatus Omnitrophota bacterium]